jgi:hypothetical protein
VKTSDGTSSLRKKKRKKKTEKRRKKKKKTRKKIFCTNILFLQVPGTSLLQPSTQE